VAGFIESLGVKAPILEHVTAGTMLAMIDRSWDFREEIRDSIRRAIGDVQRQARRTNELALELLDRAHPRDSSSAGGR
jgi:hypothetical protein